MVFSWFLRGLSLLLCKFVSRKQRKSRKCNALKCFSVKWWSPPDAIRAEDLLWLVQPQMAGSPVPHLQVTQCGFSAGPPTPTPGSPARPRARPALRSQLADWSSCLQLHRSVSPWLGGPAAPPGEQVGSLSGRQSGRGGLGPGASLVCSRLRARALVRTAGPDTCAREVVMLLTARMVRPEK